MPRRPRPRRPAKLLNRPVLLGVIGRAHGVRGLARVTSHTADPAALTGYGPLSDPSGRLFTLRWMGEGIAEISRIVDGKPVPVADRLAAEQLTNTQLFVERDRLPAPEDDEYYLTDLIGLTAVDTDAVPIGIVSAVHDYGAGASLEIARDNAGSLLIPFTAAIVPEVDIAAGHLIIVPPDEVDVRETADAGHPPPPAHHEPVPAHRDRSHERHDRSPAPHDLPSPERHAPPPSERHDPPSDHRHGPARPGHRHQRNRAATDPPVRPRDDVAAQSNRGPDADGEHTPRAEAAA